MGIIVDIETQLNLGAERTCSWRSRMFDWRLQWQKPFLFFFWKTYKWWPPARTHTWIEDSSPLFRGAMSKISDIEKVWLGCLSPGNPTSLSAAPPFHRFRASQHTLGQAIRHTGGGCSTTTMSKENQATSGTWHHWAMPNDRGHYP